MSTAMRIPMTEYLEIDLETERWRCRRCAQDLGPARGNYKEGTLVYNRDPTEIHRPLIDPGRYEFTFAPDPAWCRILEFYCPGCGTQIEAEYLPPGHPPDESAPSRLITHDRNMVVPPWTCRTRPPRRAGPALILARASAHSRRS